MFLRATIGYSTAGVFPVTVAFDVAASSVAV